MFALIFCAIFAFFSQSTSKSNFNFSCKFSFKETAKRFLKAKFLCSTFVKTLLSYGSLFCTAPGCVAA